jgi:hypothetical protein
MKKVWILTIYEYEDPLEILKVFSTKKLGLKESNEN